MAKGSLIVGSMAIAVSAIMGLGFAADAWIDHKAQQTVEQKLSLATGLTVKCAQADVNLLKQQVTIKEIRFANLNSFTSPHLFNIDRLYLQAQKLNEEPLNIETMVIQDVEINLDIKAHVNSQSSEEMMQINAQELIQNIQQQEQNNNNSSPTEEAELQIQQMEFNNIQVKAHLQLPPQSKSNPITHQFQLQQVTLNDVTDQNMSDKMSAALQNEILAELQQWINQQKDQLPSLPKPGNVPPPSQNPSLPLPSPQKGFPPFPQ